MACAAVCVLRGEAQALLTESCIALVGDDMGINSGNGLVSNLELIKLLTDF